MKTTTFIGFAFAALISGLGVSGCNNIDNAFDCSSICDKYHDCYDNDYDRSDCYSRCRDDSKHDDTFRKQADRCESCIDNKSCVDTAFSCGDDCAGIVP